MPTHIYVVATEIPSLRGGAAVRNFNLIKQYLANGHTVSVFCLTESLEDADLNTLAELGVQLYPVILPQVTPLLIAKALLLKHVPPYMLQFRKSGLGLKLAEICRQSPPDIIQFEEINAYYAVEPYLQAIVQGSSAITILDAHNVEQNALAAAFRSFGLAKRLMGWSILPFFRKLEDQTALKVDGLLCCSEEDAEYFRKLGAPQVAMIPNGVDCDYFHAQEPTIAPELLFMGGASYPPNNEALHWYFTRIHQQIKAARPDIKISIIGGKPPAWLSEMAQQDDSIKLPGFVPDVRAYLSRATVCISPMLGGSGTSLKILEYMSSARAVVSTPIGARGIDVTDKYNIALAQSETGFAMHVINLLASPSLNRALASNARQLMVEKYSWKSIGRNMNEFADFITKSEA